MWQWKAPDDASRRGVEIAEQFADGLLPVTMVEEALRNLPRYGGEEAVVWTLWPSMIWLKGKKPEAAAQSAANHASMTSDRENERRIQANLLRDIVGNPFRRVVVDPRWLTSTVVDLARSIYEGDPRQAGGNMNLPILADALMDAGCDCEELLGHCRSEGPHVRGCWVVDLILGR
jgi:hypothetical protein